MRGAELSIKAGKMFETPSIRRLTRMVRRALTEPSAIVEWLRRSLQAERNPNDIGTSNAATNRLDFNSTYRAHVAKVKASSSSESVALETAIGGQFDAFGKMQRDLLVSTGLRPEDYLIDIGCGAGRLARPLSSYLVNGRYLGTDVVHDLVHYASTISRRPDWRFEIVNGLTIPEREGEADRVCFFSVLTHLLHEESFVYLKEAKRVLRPGGKIVFSFLEFHVFSHWAVFEENIRNVGSHHHLNQFVSRDAITSWAHHLDLTIEEIFDGDKPHIVLTEPVVLDDGTRIEKVGNLGQSVCILTKR